MTNLEAQTKEVMPTTAIRLVVMLYEGAITSLEAAAAAFEKKDFDEGIKNIDMSIDIVSQLYLALDSEKGGEIADNLSRIYGYILKELQKSKDSKNVQNVRDMAGLLQHLHESWDELDQQITAEEAGSSPKLDDFRQERAAG